MVESLARDKDLLILSLRHSWRKTKGLITLDTWSTQDTRLIFFSLLFKFRPSGLFDLSIGVVITVAAGLAASMTAGPRTWSRSGTTFSPPFWSTFSVSGCSEFCENLAWTWFSSVSKMSSTSRLVSNDWLRGIFFSLVVGGDFGFCFLTASGVNGIQLFSCSL